ncbi:tyrosine-type recombinase/integrase [Robiginitalea biformata]|uniref:Tyrosine recombinase XerC n=1 Tax=Robiginitalea biformata (strain ATCC BAA-864 / DSM 15991 / KCTC 12146 / HTCC2501) TaxID=313596 RepID=A4CQ99_ROBBH|nr:tyrosine-type recombinase/integrase [Robiginitalea biformata]EAR14184.1 putative site-specific recombinase [Robiginitalea biformata HTCC2501]
MSLEAFAKYLTLEKKYAAHTVKAYLADLDAFSEYCREEQGEFALADQPYPVIRSWIIHLMESGLNNRSVNRKVASLKSYYKYQLRQGRIDASPLAAHKPLKIPRRVEIPFSESEMEGLLGEWEPSEGYEAHRDKLVVELLYTTGMRRAELIGLKLGDVDLEQGTLRVTGKRDKERILPLLPGIVREIRAYLELRGAHFKSGSEPHLFLTSRGNKLYENLVYRIINRYLSMVSAKSKRSPHILRHTFATHLLNQGADMNSVKELLGHSSLASTQVYTHNSIAELKRIHGTSHPRNKTK